MSSVWLDKSHLMHLIRNHCGIYSIKLPLTDEELFKETVQLDTVPTFSSFFPLVKSFPADLNQIRVNHDRDSEASDVSDIYQLSDIFPKNSGRYILGIRKITWFNDMRYQALQSTYETFESYQALAIAQGAANLASAIEPPYITEFIPPNRFRVSNGSYYKDRVVIHVEVSYSPELYDIPPGKRAAFYKLALLDVKRFLWQNLKRWNTVQTAIAQLNLGIDDWESAEADRNEYIEKLKESAHLGRLAAVYI